MESLYVDAHKPNLGGRRASFFRYASKIGYLPNLPTHDAVFNNKHMKLFAAKPNDLRFKQSLTAFNIDFSDI